MILARRELKCPGISSNNINVLICKSALDNHFAITIRDDLISERIVPLRIITEYRYPEESINQISENFFDFLETLDIRITSPYSKSSSKNCMIFSENKRLNAADLEILFREKLKEFAEEEMKISPESFL